MTMKRDMPLLPLDEQLPAGAEVLRSVAWVTGAITFVLAWLLTWYWETATEIAGIWWRSDTFAHGLIVLPVFGWLVWRRREWLAGSRPTAWAAVGLLALPLGLGWLVAELGSVAGAAHFMFVAMVVTGCVVMLGRRLATLLLFPLAFLFFGVPIGEFLLPAMMQHTADFAVAALRLSGIPVYQEGLYFIIPNGRWSVVEACSGVRYLIASLMVGALYAHLNYNRLSRRLAFMGVALVVPIVANWVRAYITVMVGYLFGNEAVEGFIHIVYGWVFFGIVVFLMFWIGSYWREEELAAPAVTTVMPSPPAARYWLACLPFLVISAAFPLALRSLETPVPAFSVALELPEAAAGWQRVPADQPVFTPSYHGQRGEASAIYRGEDGGDVLLYVAYYARQQRGHEMVTWGNGLLGPDRPGWRTLRSEVAELPRGGKANHEQITNGALRLDAWRWYRMDERVVTSDYLAKAFLALDRSFGRPDDSAVVVVLVNATEAPDLARKRALTFIEAHRSALERSLDAVEIPR